MPQGEWYTDEELLALTQSAFWDFQWFTPEPAQMGWADPLAWAWLPPMPWGEALWWEQMPWQEAVPELPPLIQAVASIDPNIVMWTPVDVKMEAIKMIIG